MHIEVAWRGLPFFEINEYVGVSIKTGLALSKGDEQAGVSPEYSVHRQRDMHEFVCVQLTIPKRWHKDRNRCESTMSYHQQFASFVSIGDDGNLTTVRPVS